jgi:hypothetical protein
VVCNYAGLVLACALNDIISQLICANVRILKTTFLSLRGDGSVVLLLRGSLGLGIALIFCEIRSPPKLRNIQIPM